MQYSYETVGNSSYLVATFEGGAGIVNYQLQMLANNEIKNIIKVNKRQMNEDIIVSYNITSKISLSQIDTRNKITKLGLINIIEGALDALNDIEEYQLVSSGIVFDEEYIFVNPSTYEPSFVYLPCSVEDSGIEPLKQFLLSLIMGSKVEMTNDNFVQVLLETLNNAVLTSNDLKKLCVKYKANSAQKPAAKPQQPKVEQPLVTTRPQPVPNAVPPVQTPHSAPANAVPPSIPKNNIPQTPVSPVPKAAPNNAPKKQKNKPAKESNSNKSKFIVVQIALVGLVIALAFSGVLNNEDGGISMQYLLGVLIGVVGIDFVVYREMFVNNKNDAKKEKPVKKAPAQNAKKAPVAMPGKNIPAMPSSAAKPQPAANNIPSKPQPAYKEEPQMPKQVPQAAPQAVPQAAYVPPQPVAQFDANAFESEDTVVLDEYSANNCPYLEFYENGLVTKIKLDKAVVTVGKLSSQCDFAINSNKISKIHAEFIVRGNEYFVKDCNSTNGTYINGSTQRITSNTEYQIFDGNRITLANVDLTFKC